MTAHLLTMQFPGYEKVEQVCDCRSYALYKGIQSETQESVHIHIIETQQPPISTELEKLRLLYSSWQTLANDISFPLDMGIKTEGFFLVFGDSDMLTLAKYSEQGHFIDGEGCFHLKNFILIAKKIAQLLEEPHSEEIAHQTITLEHVFIHPETHEIQLRNWGLWPILSKYRFPDILDYISPEQTGRSSNPVDYRSDFYSLGWTLYYILTGEIPYSSLSPFEKIHYHLTQTPPPPAQVNPEIPAMVSQMVLKLLAKNPEDRYQSAQGFIQDLQTCLENSQRKVNISFPLGKEDYSPRLQFPSKIYGRKEEISILRSTFSKVLQETDPQIITVSAHSGGGKTSLISHFRNDIVTHGGYLLMGKYEQFRQDIPYQGFVQVLKNLLTIILSQREEKKTEFQGRLKKILGKDGRLLTEALPEVELIIGKTPPLENLTAKENEKRFHRAFQRFFEFFAQQYPIVLFLDDLQWADDSSIQLLENLVKHQKKHILFILSYRPSSTHLALENFLEKLPRKKSFAAALDLKSLDFAQTNAFIADTLKLSTESTVSLAQIAYKQTEGNPLFLKEYLRALHHDKALVLDSEKRRWYWDWRKISQVKLSEGIVTLMRQRINNLSAQRKQILEAASCVGVSFPAEIVSQITEKKLSQTVQELEKLVQQRLLYYWEEGEYRFTHDRIQEVAYNNLSDLTKQRTHLAIARIWSQELTDKSSPQRVFAVVDQVNLGISLVEDSQEKLQFAHLNMQAGKKSRATSAYQTAARYYSVALGLFPKDAWQNHRSEMLAIHQNLADCHSFLGNLDQADHYLEVIKQQAQTNEELLCFYQMKPNICIARTDVAQAIAFTLEGLKLLGLRFSSSPSCWNFTKEKLLLGWQFWQNRNKDLVSLAPIAKGEKKLAMDLLMHLHLTTHLGNPSLGKLLAMRMLSISIKEGYSQATALAYVTYGIDMIHQNKIRQGYQLADIGIRLNDKHPNALVSVKIHLLFGIFINPWCNHLKESMRYLEHSLKENEKVGDLNSGSYARIAILNNMVLRGEALHLIKEKLERFFQQAVQDGYQENLEIICMKRQMILCLEGKTGSLASFSTPEFSEQEHVELFKTSQGRAHVLHGYYVMKLRTLFLSGSYQQALEIAEKAEQNIGKYFLSHPNLGEYYFYYSLVLCALDHEVRGVQRSYFRSKIKKFFKYLRHWNSLCPANFAHKVLLVEAELTRIRGKDMDLATRLYEQAIVEARKSEFLQHLATAHELAGRFHAQRGLDSIAKGYLLEARHCFAYWGAIAKVKQLENTYRNVYPTSLDVNAYKTNYLPSSMDLESIIQSSHTLTKEIHLPDLLAKFMKIVATNTGAHKSTLLLTNQKQELFVEAEIQNTPDKVLVRSIPLSEYQALPHTLMRYVKNTQKNILLIAESLLAPSSFVDAFAAHDIILESLAESIYQDDIYIKKNSPQAILCLIVSKGEEFLGILYLESRTNPKAFSAERFSILNAIIGQAAIALENALLYQRVKEENEHREQLKRKLQDTNYYLEKTVKKLQHTQNKIIQHERLHVLGKMISGIAHDFDNSLSPVLGFTDLLLAHPEYLEEVDKVIEFLEIINMAARDSANVVQRLRDFYRSRSDDEPLALIDLNAIVAQTIQLSEPRWKMMLQTQNKSIDVRFYPQAEQLPKIRGNEAELREMLLNLIFNAIDAIEEKGQVEIYTSQENFQISQLQELGAEFPSMEGPQEDTLISRVVLRVSDNGMGMSNEIRQRCLEPFFSTKGKKGTGMGLPMVYGSIQRHEGTLDVTSKIKKGTTFTITFPICLEEEEDMASPDAQLGDTLENFHVLVAEDDHMTRRLLKEYLQNFGCHFSLATNGEEAWKRYQLDKFDIVLTDRAMVRMGGDELAKHIKQDSPETPVVMLSALGKIMKARGEIPPHVDMLLNKPITERELYRALERMINKLQISKK